VTSRASDSPSASGRAREGDGQVQYVADLKPRGLLHAKLLRSPHAHARIVKIDTSRAQALPGVRAVLTAADIPELKRKAPTRAHAVLAIDRVVFVGNLWPPWPPTSCQSPKSPRPDRTSVRRAAAAGIRSSP